MLRFEDEAAFDRLVPNGEAGEYQDGDNQVHRMAKKRPRTNAIPLVQINEFHKFHQVANATSENESCGQEFRNERPVRIEVAKNVADKARQKEKYGVTVKPGNQSINNVTDPAAPRNVRHLDRQIPDVPLYPTAHVSG